MDSMDKHDEDHITPHGGNVYLGYANINDRPLFFPLENNQRNGSNDNHNFDQSNQSDSDDWIPTKPQNNPPVLMGYVDENERIPFNEGEGELPYHNDYIARKNKEVNARFTDNDDSKSNDNDEDEDDQFNQKYTNTRGLPMAIESMLAFPDNDSPFTSSNVSLNSSQMADLVIGDNLTRARSNASSASSTSANSNSSSIF